MSAYAQPGQEDRCVRCGLKVEFREVAHDAVSGEPVYRWVAVRKTKRAPIPMVCPSHNTKGGHLTEHWSVNGAPLGGGVTLR